MLGMRVRYDVGDMNLRISNVTPAESQTYVLITASDNQNEIVFEMSIQQADRLQAELFEAQRRRRENANEPAEPAGAVPFAVAPPRSPALTPLAGNPAFGDQPNRTQ
ncbi:hypothetical protein [Paenibacillus xerothermodurans]|uniref:Uncharacterized protein n=1 Tax=Paenibacillus xerothermodurans TaxID=1977292 RepID=A0A2W1NRU1_PAEXE|nr:hypothetical protein [Paenibacillus xerothermodurans]PZE21563.1 hypothetical protein CBW46_003685 [Paenibacillus xerothermodurans]